MKTKSTLVLEVRITEINESGSKTEALTLIHHCYNSDQLERQIAGISLRAKGVMDTRLIMHKWLNICSNSWRNIKFGE
jgi:hypothetical protein